MMPESRISRVTCLAGHAEAWRQNAAGSMLSELEERDSEIRRRSVDKRWRG
jgi:hypothetical protein